MERISFGSHRSHLRIYAVLEYVIYPLKKMKLSSTERALVLLMLIESRNDSDMERLLLSYLLIKAFENDSSDDDTSSDSEVSDTDEEEPVVKRKVAAPSRVQTNGAQKSYVRAAPKRKTPQSSSKVAQKRRRVTEMVTCATSKSGAEDGTTSDSSLLSEDPLATVKIERESDDETSQNHYIKIEPVESHLVDNLCVNESDLQHAQSANEIKDEIEIKDELLNM